MVKNLEEAFQQDFIKKSFYIIKSFLVNFYEKKKLKEIFKMTDVARKKKFKGNF